jgi:hypothetical protein
MSEVDQKDLDRLLKRPDIQTAMQSLKDLIMQRIENLLEMDGSKPAHPKMQDAESVEETFAVLKTECDTYIPELREKYASMFDVGDFWIHPVVDLDVEKKAINVNVFLRDKSDKTETEETE